MGTLREWKRRLKRFAITLSIACIGIMTIGAVAAYAQAEADAPITPVGPGGFISLPDLTQGGNKTLFEQLQGSNAYLNIDHTQSWTDGVGGATISTLNVLTNFFMSGIYTCTKAGIALSWWLMSLTKIDGVNDTISTVLTAEAQTLMAWALPSALAIGAVIVLVKTGARGEFISQIFVMVIIGAIFMSLTTNAKAWVNATDDARVLGVTAVSSISQAVTVNETTPVAIPNPKPLNGDSADLLLRQTGDSVFRVMAVTPWCLGQFGSIAACEKYGANVITKLGDDRRKAMDDVRDKQAGSGTDKWTMGDDEGQRLAITGIALIVVVAFVIMLISLGFAAARAMIMSLFFLVTAPLALILMIIPGVTRNWGKSLISALFESIIEAIISLALFSIYLVIITVLYTASASLGWLGSMGLTLTAAFAGSAVRARLSKALGVEGVAGRGGIGALGALAAMRGVGMASRAVKGTGRAVGGGVRAARGVARGVRSGATGAARAHSAISGAITKQRAARQQPRKNRPTRGGPGAGGPTRGGPGAGGPTRGGQRLSEEKINHPHLRGKSDAAYTRSAPQQSAAGSKGGQRPATRRPAVKLSTTRGTPARGVTDMPRMLRGSTAQPQRPVQQARQGQAAQPRPVQQARQGQAAQPQRPLTVKNRRPRGQ